ncbi:MAG: hypothetical protein KKH94_05395 [Candidatus Omnitrophica bacterium]|nr:hypothetical protein [Candidatus Omnitrophota bacterium]
MKTANITLLVILIIVIVCVLSECILFFTGKIYSRNLYVHDYTQNTHVAYTTNIICLGESSTAGLWVPKEESYPAQLERLLQRHYSTYSTKSIKVFVPPHVGQNTSQMVNRINDCIDAYKPSLIVIMVGANNEWSLAESNIINFLSYNTFDKTRMKLYILLHDMRLFKIFKYLFATYFTHKNIVYPTDEEKKSYLDCVVGGIEYYPFPPEKYISDFARVHHKEFVDLWKYDVETIISIAKKRKVNIILMSYPAGIYVKSKEFVHMAKKHNIPLIRNDIIFKELSQMKPHEDYFLPHDRWHPNEKGYTIIAHNVFECIQKKHLI